MTYWQKSETFRQSGGVMMNFEQKNLAWKLKGLVEEASCHFCYAQLQGK